MEPVHRSRISTRFRPQLQGKNLAVPCIPDRFDWMDPELVGLPRKKMLPCLPAGARGV